MITTINYTELGIVKHIFSMSVDNKITHIVVSIGGTAKRLRLIPGDLIRQISENAIHVG
jgi:hypothetical protein